MTHQRTQHLEKFPFFPESPVRSNVHKYIVLSNLCQDVGLISNLLEVVSNR